MPLGLIAGGIGLAAGASLGTAALLGVAGAGIGSVIESGINSSKANDIASGQLSLEQNIAGEQQGFEQQLAQLIANPSSVSSLPGYQFQLSQGSEATARGMAAGGFLNSGNEATALTQYGQGLASSFYSQQTQLLSSLSGITAPSSPSQLGTSATGAQSSSNAQLQALLGQLGLAAGKFSSAGTPSAANQVQGGGMTYNGGGASGFGAFGLLQ
jgi:hypothetical protein